MICTPRITLFQQDPTSVHGKAYIHRFCHVLVSIRAFRSKGHYLAGSGQNNLRYRLPTNDLPIEDF